METEVVLTVAKRWEQRWCAGRHKKQDNQEAHDRGPEGCSSGWGVLYPKSGGGEPMLMCHADVHRYLGVDPDG